MAKKNQMQMPQSTAGLVRYFDTTKETIKIKPEMVVFGSIAIIAIVLAARFLFV